MTDPVSPTLVECPRDSWQGYSRVIPTAEKVAYLRALVAAGLTHIDFGSFVSPKAVPQTQDTEHVWAGVREYARNACFIAVIVNPRGLDRALAVGGLPAVGYPLSLSETFQRRNASMSVDDSWSVLESISARASQARIDLQVYLSMGFGNPYGEPWSVPAVVAAVTRIRDSGVRVVMLADTIGCATPGQIAEVYAACRVRCPDVTVGAHFHAAPRDWRARVEAALGEGCTRIDSAIGGIGGCPFAQDELVGNVPTEGLREWLGRLPTNRERWTAVVAEAQRLHHDYR